MIGNLYQVPDKWWGFEAVGRKDHPGACVSMASAHRVNLFKGTDPRSADFNLVQIEVEPDDSNNLLKTTSFGVKPYQQNARKVGLLQGEKFIGVLVEADQIAMQAALEKYFSDGGA